MLCELQFGVLRLEMTVHLSLVSQSGAYFSLGVFCECDSPNALIKKKKKSVLSPSSGKASQSHLKAKYPKHEY